MTGERMLCAVAALCSRAGGAAVALIALIVTGDVVSRNLFGTVIFNAFEISTYLFAISVALGLASTALNGAHIRIDVLLARLPMPVRRILNAGAFLSLAGLAVLLAWFAARLTIESYERGTMSNSAAAIELYLPQGFWAAGLAIFAVSALWYAVDYIRLLAAGDLAAADALADDDKVAAEGEAKK